MGGEIFEAYKSNWPSYVSYAFLDKEGSKKILLHEFSWAKLSELIANCHVSASSEDRTEAGKSVNRSLGKLTQNGALAACAQTKSWNTKSAVLNNMLSSFVRTHLTDVLVYDGDFGSVIRDALGELLATELAEELKATDEGKIKLAFITHSLGSKIVVDLLREDSNAFTHPYDKLDKKTLNNYRQKFNTIPVYMFANQLTLLRLNNLCTGPRCARGVDAVNTSQKPVSQVSKNLKNALIPRLVTHDMSNPFALDLVAYSDPNDVLSFEIPKNTYLENTSTNTELRAWNIRIGTTSAAWSLGLLAWPVSAHNNYWTNSVVLDSMLCGASPIKASETKRSACLQGEQSPIQTLKTLSP